MDNFEKRILNKRREMDPLDPAPRIWEGIEENLENGGKQRFLSFSFALKIAAALSGVIFVFWLGFIAGGNGEEQQQAVIPEQYHEAEQFYLGKIESSKAMVLSYELDEDLDYTFKKDLMQLDSIYIQLKNLLIKKGPQPRLMENMILNLQKQSKLLELQLEIIDKQKKRGHEKQQISA